MPPFIACPSCSCAVKLQEEACPHCGATVRSADGAVARTAIAIVLGLSSVAALSGCPSPPSAPKYGVPATEGPVTTTTVAEPTPEPTPAPTETVPEMAPKYGVPATPEPRPEPEVRPLYGVPGTSQN